MESKVRNVYDTENNGQQSESEDEDFINGNAGVLERNNVHDDPEAQNTVKRTKGTRTAVEYQIPTSTKYLYLAVYFALNLALTIYNKYVLGKVCRPILKPYQTFMPI